MKKLLLGFIVTAAFYAMSSTKVCAETEGDYWTDGCMETITEQMNTDVLIGMQWRILYKCCGSNCWMRTDWMTQIGPVQLCGGARYVSPESSSMHPLEHDPNGNVMVAVATGKGGMIGNSSTGCYPFTDNGGDVILIAAGI